jgi:hypothetical protein
MSLNVLDLKDYVAKRAGGSHPLLTDPVFSGLTQGHGNQSWKAEVIRVGSPDGHAPHNVNRLPGVVPSVSMIQPEMRAGHSDLRVNTGGYGQR